MVRWQGREVEAKQKGQRSTAVVTRLWLYVSLPKPLKLVETSTASNDVSAMNWQSELTQK
ncbi:MAG: hypothetical protein FRX49_03180 [Trebouxia sp. A1-2]|nr:MAG: hypothetical protein FRX49_03180 [Trebouxia sp. A1-2]